MVGFIAAYTFTTRDYRQYSSVAILHALQFTFTHALGFSVFTSRILATDLYPSHCQLKSHMKFSFHSLMPFLPLFCNCEFRRLDSVQFLCSQAHILAGWRLGSRLHSRQQLTQMNSSSAELSHLPTTSSSQLTPSL
jgi:hypothetical protein